MPRKPQNTANRAPRAAKEGETIVSPAFVKTLAIGWTLGALFVLSLLDVRVVAPLFRRGVGVLGIAMAVAANTLLLGLAVLGVIVVRSVTRWERIHRPQR